MTFSNSAVPIKKAKSLAALTGVVLTPPKGSDKTPVGLFVFKKRFRDNLWEKKKLFKSLLAPKALYLGRQLKGINR